MTERRYVRTIDRAGSVGGGEAEISADKAAWIRSIPKVELRVHLEDAATPEAYWRIAEKNGSVLPASSLDAWRQFFRFRDFAHFIEVYTTAASLLRGAEDYYDLILDFGADRARQNIVWTEAFVSLSHAPLDDSVQLLDGLRDAERLHDARICLIGDIARHLPESRRRVLEILLAGKSMGVFAGIGLGGLEEGHPPDEFADVSEEASRAGLFAVAHVGEGTGARHIPATLSKLGARRLGHGIGVLADPGLTKSLAQQQIPFEVCPTSSYALGIVVRGEVNPVRQTKDAGLLCTINSDDPAMFGSDLEGEFQLLSDQGFSDHELLSFVRNSVRVSIMPEASKSKLLGHIGEFGIAGGSIS